MNKKELIKLIQETLYGELPEIINEIKSSIRDEMLSEAHRKAAINPNPTKSNKTKSVGAISEQTIQQGGILEWFAGKVESGETMDKPDHGQSPEQITDYMSDLFGKKIQ